MLGDLSRNLRHFRRSALAIAAGAAIATSVLAGALLIGDSVRASLRRLTLERLGGIDYALAGQRFFSEATARDFAAELTAEGREAAPAILLRGAVEHAQSHSRENGVGIEGVDPAFFRLFADGDPHSSADPFQEPAQGAEKSVFPPVLINRSLAEAMDAAPGDQLLLSLQRATEVPAGSLLARDDTQAVVGLVRAVVHAVIPDEGLGSFRLDAHQGTARNAFLPLGALQKALEIEGQVNAILVRDPARRGSAMEEQQQESARLDTRLGGRLKLDDYAVEIERGGNLAAVQSRELLVRPALAEATERAARKTGASVSPLLTWLVNEIRHGERRVPYSTVTALEMPQAPAFGTFEVSGEPAGAVDGIWLNEWLADQLAARPGDRVSLAYYEVGPREELIEKTREIVVAGLVALRGAALDPLYTQEYPGISGSTHMSDWDPPFPIELSRIRQTDEDYWDRYRATPKAFLPLATGQLWWQTRWGQLSTVRLAPPAGEELDVFVMRFAKALRAELAPAAFGMTFLPVKSLGLRASGGATDFGGLFFGLSFFVIAAAALLISLLMSLWIEQRSGEIGLRLAVGFERKTVRRGLLAEGALLAGLGSLAGLAGALGYAWLMMLGLRTFWRPAVGTSRLELVPTPMALAAGLLIALAITVATIAWTLRGVGRTPVPQLLRRAPAGTFPSRTGRKAFYVATMGLVPGAALLVFGAAAPTTVGPFAFFLAGVLLLAGLLGAFALLMQRVAPALEPGALASWRIALANTRRQYKRSLLATTLIALSTFLIVLVAAFEVDFSKADTGKDSGAGGFALVAETQVPLQYDLGTQDGRAELGLADAPFEDASIYPARLLPGEDTSCLNLYQPTRPRLLGLPADFLERGGFRFKQLADGASAERPWSVLERDLGPNVIPVVGDFNSTQWILKLPLGGRLPFENEHGEKIELELVGALDTSIFQSELLLSEAQLLRHFPSRGGYSYFLIEAPAAHIGELSQQLESGLQRYGLDAERTGARLAAFHAVQNTYLSTFRSLGGLGLLLGTFGLAVVLVRNVIERRGELAAMRAFGFERAYLQRLIVYENLALLLAGLAIGTLAALAAAFSQLLAHPSAIPFAAILATLASIAVAGAVAAWLAARAALSAPLLPALKAES